MTKSFRSTQEIVAVGNAVLQETRGAAAARAVPVQRYGPQPQVFRGDDEDAMYLRIANDLKALLASETPLTNVALITPSEEASRVLVEKLRLYGLEPDHVISLAKAATDYRGGVVVVPVVLSKGLEFEAVFVVQASDATYNQRVPYDGRLLYVAVTRALHQLNLYHTEDLSGFLRPAVAQGTLTVVNSEPAATSS